MCIYCNDFETRNIEAIQRLLPNSIEYPTNFPNLVIKVGGHVLDKKTLETLLPSTNIEDGVSNAFFLLLLKEAKNIECNVMIFDSLFTERLITTGEVSNGFNNLFKTYKLFESLVWLFPICYRNHWTLLVVDFGNHNFVFLNS